MKKLSDTPPNIPDSLTWDPFGGKLSIIPSTPKLRRFGQNGVVLQILRFFFLMKKRRKFKNKKI
jgi:hypothetical protein